MARRHEPSIGSVRLIKNPQIPDSQFPGRQKIRAKPLAAARFVKRLKLQLFSDSIPEDRSVSSGKVRELILR